MKLNEDYIIDEKGRYVFTRAYHLKRGYCCKSGCRNCPYGFSSRETFERNKEVNVETEIHEFQPKPDSAKANTENLFLTIDFLDPQFKLNPYPYYEKVRLRNPIYWSPQANAWFILNYTDVVQYIRDKRLSSARSAEFIKRLPESERHQFLPLQENLARWTLLTDPPEHTRHRVLLGKAFQPKVIEGMSERILKVTDELIDHVIGNGEMDFIRDFAYPLPVIVISEILGVPQEDRDQMKAWSDGISEFLASPKVSRESAEHAQKCVLEMNAYFVSIIEERRQNPQGDFLSYLVQAEEQGQVLHDEELLAICSLLIFAGHETTTNLLGNGLLALLLNSNEFAKLKSDLSLLPQAIEELLRYDAPVQMTSRLVVEDIPLGAFTAKKGQRLFFVLGAANRDPARYENPTVLELARKDIRPLSFGHGIHFCPGAGLSKLEGKIAFQRLMERLPKLSMASVPLDWRSELSFRGLRAFPVQF